jgi:hypothetical protein
MGLVLDCRKQALGRALIGSMRTILDRINKIGTEKRPLRRRSSIRRLLLSFRSGPPCGRAGALERSHQDAAAFKRTWLVENKIRQRFTDYRPTPTPERLVSEGSEYPVSVVGRRNGCIRD